MLGFTRQYLQAFIACFSFYAFSISPSISWGDSSDFAIRLAGFPFAESEGGTRDYDLYELITKPFAFVPFGDYGYKANLASAFFGAISVCLLYRIAFIVSNSKIISLLSSGSLLVSHTYWFLASVAEVYTFSTFLILSSILAVMYFEKSPGKSEAVVTGTLLGANILHHPSGLVLFFTTLTSLLLFRRPINTKLVLLILISALLASARYWIEVIGRLQIQRDLLDSLQIGTPQNSLTSYSLMVETLKFFALAFYNFPFLGILFISAGVTYVVRQKSVGLLSLTLFSLLIIIAGIRSSIPDKFNIFVIANPGLAILFGLGLFKFQLRFPFLSKFKREFVIITLVIPPTLYLATWQAFDRLGNNPSGARDVPQRNNNEYFFWPPKSLDFGPKVYARNALLKLPLNAILLADYTVYKPIEFMQRVENVRPDVKLLYVEAYWNGGLNSLLEETLGRERVFIAHDKPPHYFGLDKLSEKFRLDYSTEGIEIITND